MKKEYLILALIIIGLSAYLALHREDGSHYELPQFSRVETGEITSLALETKDGSLTLIKDNDSWKVGDKGFPADRTRVDAMLKVVEDFEVTALVSDIQDLSRYELDDNHRIRVIAKKGDEILRRFDIGKTAPTYNHTFVALPGEKGVFHARGSFQNDFDKTLDELRDKLVFTLDGDRASRLLVEKGDHRLELTRTKAASEKSGTEKTETAKADEAKPVWQTSDGESPDQDAPESLISSLKSLDCSGFSKEDDKAPYEGKTPLFSITVEDGSQAVLNIFPKDKKNNYPGISSRSPYPFFLDSYQAENLLKKVDGLLGIEEAEKQDTEN